MEVLRIIKRYWIVTCVPILTATVIILDLNHTRNWKKQLAAQKKLKLES